MATGTLTSTTIAARYKSLLKLTGTANDVLAADASAKYVEDGDGNDSVLSLSTTRVGIGNTAPTALLTAGAITTLVTDGTTAVTPEGVNVHITEASKYAMGIKNADASGDGLLIQAGDAADDFALRVEDYDSANDLLVVQGGGLVGIGTASPGSPLSILKSNLTNVSSDILRIENSGTGSTLSGTGAGLTFVVGDTNAGPSNVGFIWGQQTGEAGTWDAAASLNFRAGNVTPTVSNAAMTILPAGTVGIGTSAPANESSGTLLHIADTGSSNAAHINMSGGDGNDASQTGKITFSDPGDPADGVAFISANIEGGTANPGGNLHFFTSTTGSGEGANTVAEKMAISGAGDVTVSTGNLIIGTAGKGVDFSAYATSGNPNSNLLDDYEEGTWQPAYACGTGSITAHPLASLGTYTKIGNMVHLSTHLQIVSISSGPSPSGALTISGMPFTVEANATHGEDSGSATGTVEVNGLLSSLHILQLSAAGGATALRLSEFDGTTLADDVANHFDDGTTMRIAISYKV